MEKISALSVAIGFVYIGAIGALFSLLSGFERKGRFLELESFCFYSRTT
jgi:hypothetical protein